MRIIPALLIALGSSAISCVAQEKLTLDESYVVYARVKTDPSGTTCVRLAGTEIKHDLDGDSIVWN